jgi:predicted kinase
MRPSLSHSLAALLVPVILPRATLEVKCSHPWRAECPYIVFCGVAVAEREASGYAISMNTPQLIVMSGLPGTGKSTIAERVAERLKLPILSVDPIESAIIRAGIPRSFATGLAAYLVAEALAGEQLTLGNSVLIDAVNAEEEGKDVWRGLASRHGIELIVLQVIVSDRAEHKQRIATRVRSLHGLSEVTWDQVEARERVFTAWRENVLTLDSSRDIDANVEEALTFIEAQQP